MFRAHTAPRAMVGNRGSVRRSLEWPHVLIGIIQHASRHATEALNKW